jgi:hypothetical protein
MDLKPRLSGENSIIASLATVGLVVGVYQSTIGPVSDVHATEPNDVNLAASVRKAGWLSLAFVSAMTLLAKDPNILILGGAAIIVEELCYRHALMVHPGTGQIAITPAAYMPAGMPGAGTVAAAAG